MTKESILEFQKIDCNCNDCKHMERDIIKHNRSEILHHLWQIDYFIVIRQKLLDAGRDWIKKGNQEKGDILLAEAAKMKFQYNNTSYVNFGYCNKFDKDVSFIPNTCQLETQNCFKHRRI